MAHIVIEREICELHLKLNLTDSFSLCPFVKGIPSIVESLKMP